jgi:uncharacterized protein (DUF2141 family)
MKIFCLVFLFALTSLPEKENGEIKLIINDTKSNSGVIRVLIFDQADGFPEEAKKAFKALSIPVENFSAQTTIKNLPAGNYAVSVFHDQDGDGVFKKNSIGLPIDSYGFSNNPTLFFGPPSFSKCKVAINNEPVSVEINLK